MKNLKEIESSGLILMKNQELENVNGGYDSCDFFYDLGAATSMFVTCLSFYSLR
ncbi:hypothetical protein [Marinoscillum furvescens]|uniref:Uncharacterized protein n=1 Tax=Marinoscillum furvescens DSM 4134 TaxID=1122208 RepID=A0A3D9KW38_MARFU|nr:hypothetical protein [Marinoscillum furvescens]RED92073.1 hypothetical protein C7460_13342 [Marinoscillum furvescens DSM 4134]